MTNSTASRVAMTAAFLLTACLFTVDSAMAQSHSLQVTVPFDFYAGDKLLPAGDYQVSAFDNAVTLHSAATRESAGIQTQALKKVSGVLVSPELIFNTYGQDHFLSEVWWGRGTSVGSMAMISKRETEIAKTAHPTRIEARARR
jgi:hypothetical protein